MPNDTSSQLSYDACQSELFKFPFSDFFFFNTNLLDSCGYFLTSQSMKIQVWYVHQQTDLCMLKFKLTDAL